MAKDKKIAYPSKEIELSNGEILVIRQALQKEVPKLLKAIKPLLKVSKDYYNIVSAKTYAELLSWYHNNVCNSYCLIGLINGELVGLANGHLVDKKIGMSYHTIAMKRGLRIGTHLFLAKMEYHFMLGNKKVYIIAESPIGFRRWMQELHLKFSKNIPHELGGVPSWILTKDNFENFIKPNKVFGNRPLSKESLEKSKNIITPNKKILIGRIKGKLK